MVVFLFPCFLFFSLMMSGNTSNHVKLNALGIFKDLKIYNFSLGNRLGMYRKRYVDALNNWSLFIPKCKIMIINIKQHSPFFDYSATAKLLVWSTPGIRGLLSSLELLNHRRPTINWDSKR